MAISVAALIGVVLAAAFVSDEPLRRYVERSANEAVEGYSVHIGALALHPLLLSVALRDVAVRHKAHPDLPLLNIPRMEIDARFAPLLVGTVAADIYLNDPIVSMSQQQVATVLEQGTGESSQAAGAWQDQIRDKIPLEVTLFLKNGEVTYTGQHTTKPIRVTALDAVMRNVTNRPKPNPIYPTEIRIAATLLDHAEIEIHGRADLLAKPAPATQFAIRLNHVEIHEVLASVGRVDLPVKSGTLGLAGHIEFSSTDRAMTIDSLNVTRPQIEYVNDQTPSTSTESDDAVAAKVPTWQEQALALFPISIREIGIDDGTVIYRHAPKADPIQLTGLTVSVQDIRNATAQSSEYPSRIQVRTRVGEQGLVEIDGRGDFFAQPTPAIEARVRLSQLRLLDLAPIASAYNVHIDDGLIGMEGRVKHDKQTLVALESFLLEHGKVDYVYRPGTRYRQKRQVQHGVSQVAKAHKDPSFVFKMGHGKILASEVGFINRTTKPDYRMFLADLNADMDNFSNRLEEGTGIIKVTGKFMGSGPTVMTGTFRPEKPRPDFDLAVTIIRTDVTALNDVLRAYGTVDTHHGQFALFSELTVKNNRIDGYVKPLFRDVDTYDPKKDEDKALSKKIYKAVVGGVIALLENQPRDEVATNTDVSGAVENPQASTWQIIEKLVQNAFFNAILPGFEGKA